MDNQDAKNVYGYQWVAFGFLIKDKEKTHEVQIPFKVIFLNREQALSYRQQFIENVTTSLLDNDDMYLNSDGLKVELKEVKIVRCQT